jgi:hypothetical protein
MFLFTRQLGLYVIVIIYFSYCPYIRFHILSNMVSEILLCSILVGMEQRMIYLRVSCQYRCLSTRYTIFYMIDGFFIPLGHIPLVSTARAHVEIYIFMSLHDATLYSI